MTIVEAWTTKHFMQRSVHGKKVCNVMEGCGFDPRVSIARSRRGPQNLSLHVTLFTAVQQKEEWSREMTCNTTIVHLYGDGTNACNRNLKSLTKEWPDPATGKLSEPTATDITFVEAWTSFAKLFSVDRTLHKTSRGPRFHKF
jgi:hypothetical protein